MSCLCLGSCALSWCGCASVQACGECKPSSNTSRYPYAGITITASLFALFLQHIGHKNIIGNWAICDIIKMKTCSDNAGVQRIFFALSLFFIIHAITIKFWNDFHKLLWLPKILITTICIISLFFIDNDPFEGYSHLARYMAALYLLFQIVIYINMLYDWNESWVAQENFKSILCVSLILYIISIIFFTISFVHFAPNSEDCSRNTTLLATAIIMCVLFTLLSIYVEHGAILPSAGVTAYISYLLYSGLSYDSNKQCNSSVFSDHTTTQVIIGLIMICIGVGYFVASNTPHLIDSNRNEINPSNGNDIELATEDKGLKTDNNNNDNDKSNYDDDDNGIKTGNYEDSSSVDDIEKGDNNNNNNSVNVDNTIEIQSINIMFHLLMFLACFYILMVFTAWQTKSHTKGNQSETILWINVTTHWGVIILYIVTLIAPLICPSRFNHDDEY